jgi:hypothetical protein
MVGSAVLVLMASPRLQWGVQPSVEAPGMPQRYGAGEACCPDRVPRRTRHWSRQGKPATLELGASPGKGLLLPSGCEPSWRQSHPIKASPADR